MSIQDKFEKSVTDGLKAKGLIRDEDGVPTRVDTRQVELDQRWEEGFKNGYQQALNDMKRELEKLQQNRRYKI